MLNETNNKNIYLKQFSFFYIPTAIIITAIIYFSFSIDKENRLNLLKIAERTATNNKINIIESELGIAKAELRTLASNNDLFSYLNTGDKKYLKTLEQDYVKYFAGKDLFNQIILFDVNGKELLRVEYRSGHPYAVEDSVLLSDSNEYEYLNDIFKLDENEIYVSELELLKKYNRIARPYKPIIKFGVPLFGFDEKRAGAIVYYYNAERFLRLIDENTFEHSSKTMLVNSGGYFLHSPDATEEWGFMFDDRKDMNMENKFEGVWPLMTGELNGQLETKYGVFTFNTVYPSFGYSLKDMLSQNLTEVYSWKIISFVARSSLKEVLFAITKRWLFIGLFFILSAALAVGFISFLRVKNILAVQQIEFHLDEVTNLNERLVKSEKHLIEENKNKDRFISILSHDLKNPLGVLRNFTNMLKDDYDELENNERKSFIDSINDIAENTVNLLLTLLDWSRLNLGTMEYTPECIGLSKIVDNNIRLFRYQSEGKGISLTSEVEDDMRIFADENMLNALLRNFISNAVKFTDDGGYVKVNAWELERSVKVCIEDSGVGMTGKQKDQLFDNSKRFSTYGTKNEAGTGIGFNLCRELIEKMNGKIYVESEKGKGSKFYFELPKGKEVCGKCERKAEDETGD